MTENVYRRKQKGKVSQYYTGRYSLERGAKPVTVALHLKDEAAARAKLREIITEAQREAYGLLPKKSYREAAGASLSALLDAYKADLTAQGRKENHIKETVARVRKIVVACKWRRLRDISPARFLAWRATFERAAKTRKEYQVSLNAFLNWLVDTERLERNPLKRVPMPETRGKSVRPSRAFTLDELRALFEASGDNSLFYQTLAYTGQRYSEIAALAWSDLSLGAAPLLRVRAENSKDKADRSIPLHPSLAAALRAAKPQNAKPDETVFKDVPSIERFYTDLKRAGIERKDATGRVVHLHALRKTFLTLGAQHGMSQRAAQEFAHHSDANLTANTYTDVTALRLADEMEKIPWWVTQKEKMRGGVTKPRKNGPLIDKINDLVEILKRIDDRDLATETTDLELAARHGFEP